jgi:hypothetical protein
MSRSMLSFMTALTLAMASLGTMAYRRSIGAAHAAFPTSASSWHIRMVLTGKTLSPEARILSLVPYDFARQHVVREECHSVELIARPPDLRHSERRQTIWLPRSGRHNGPFRATYDFCCLMDPKRPSSALKEQERCLYQSPQAGQHLDSDSGVTSDAAQISALARYLATELHEPADIALAFFHYVDASIGNEPSPGLPTLTAIDCLRHRQGDSAGKSRLLASLLRYRGIQARLVTGITLANATEQVAHVWVEAWVNGHWLPMCPFHHHYGRLPANYLVLTLGDSPVAHARHVSDLDYAFFIERIVEPPRPADESWPKRVFELISLYRLPPAEQRLVEFLLLLPLAALLICVYRNVIGIHSFGTFAPALVGLAFRDWHSLPGILIFIGIVIVGWMLRRVLDHYHLLQVPRTAFLLTLVVILLIVTVVACNSGNPPLAATQYVSLFPMIILTGMIERFWTLENEDGAASSLRTLLATMFMAVSIALFLSLRPLVHHMFRYPETLGLVMAAQLLIGRYTGYKITELWRFRELAGKDAVHLLRLNLE